MNNNIFSERTNNLVKNSVRDTHKLLRFYLHNIQKNLDLLDYKKDYLMDHECSSLNLFVQKMNFLLNYNRRQKEAGYKYVK